MRAVPGIYHEGRITFPMSVPHHVGPVCVLVVFPGPCDETLHAGITVAEGRPLLPHEEDVPV